MVRLAPNLLVVINTWDFLPSSIWIWLFSLMDMVVMGLRYGYDCLLRWIWFLDFSKLQDHGLFCRFLRLFSDFHVMETTDGIQPSCVAAIAMSGKTHDQLQFLLCALCCNVLHLRFIMF